MVDHVVSEHELCAGGVLVQSAQRGREVAVAVGAGVGGCRTDGGEALNPAGVRIDLEVDRDASRKKLLRPHCFSRIPTVQAVAPDVRMPPGAIRNLEKVYRPKNTCNPILGGGITGTDERPTTDPIPGGNTGAHSDAPNGGACRRVGQTFACALSLGPG